MVDDKFHIKVEQLQREVVSPLKEEIGKVIVGQHALVDSLLIALLTGNHVLLEGVPGLAKTLSITCLAAVISGSFRRIQFTPDLLPADLTGTLIYNPKSGEFSTKKGPIFANIILADEINRAPAKVQSALLEAMQERQVTIGDKSYPLEEPFMVLATQNPLEHEGTYPLPEAQVDRFMLKLRITYPTRDEELEILRRMSGSEAQPSPCAVLSLAQVLAARELVRHVYLDQKIENYILDLVQATRSPERVNKRLEGLVRCGASPRAAIFLAVAAKAQALLHTRAYVTPQDVKDVALDVLAHRVIVTYEAEAEGKSAVEIVQEVLRSVRVP